MSKIEKLQRRRKTIFNDAWAWRMAWRDASKNYTRLALFVASLVTGIASVVSLDSLNHVLQHDIDENARELIGADFVLNSDKKFKSEAIELFDSLKYDQASEASLASMITFTKSTQSRLIRLVAVSETFPFYGAVETDPSTAYSTLNKGNFAVLDESLASQFGVEAGDSVKLGKSVFSVAGVVKKLPGGGGIMTTFTPSVYINYNNLDSTGLVQYGSRVSYKRFFKTPTEKEANEVTTSIEPKVKKLGMSIETVQRRKEGLGRGFMSIYQFFSLLGFVALLLGCIGVASSVHIYAKEKRDEVAVLRCIGSSGWQAFNIYFIQIFVLGVIGSIIGSFLGIGVQQLIPLVLKGIIPFDISFSLSWNSLALGVAVGIFVSVLFSILPLVAVRFVPPLTVLRGDISSTRRLSKTTLFVGILIFIFPIAFTSWQTHNLVNGLMFTLGMLLVLILLTGVAWLMLKLVKRYFPSRASFVWRHALSNLFRPNNQTRVLMVTIGLGAFIISTLTVVEQSLLGQVEFAGQSNQSNTILFDIQPYQKEGIISLMKEHGLKLNQVVPIVTCRLQEVNGVSTIALQQDSTNGIPEWALTREYRVTYRDSLTRSEELIEGTKQSMNEGVDSVGVTISEDMLKNLKLKVGDPIVFDVQGVPMRGRINGVRKVDWPKDPPNFIFVFPTGVLETAPQAFVTATHVDSLAQGNAFQRQLVTQFPNVSMIDLSLVLNTINDLFNKLGLVIRVLALFSVVTGLLVLAGAVINSKFVRMKENVLLRTIGARTGQITIITLIEYVYLGLFASLTGMVLALGGGWLLTRFFFNIVFAFSMVELLTVTAGIVTLTVFIGWFNSRSILTAPPLQILRREG